VAEYGLCFAFPQEESEVKKTYMAIQTEIAKLQKQAEAARKAEVAEVVARIKQAISVYGFTAEDLGFGRAPIPRRRGNKEAQPVPGRSTGVARYRDPTTGKTWTGQGRPPAWIADAKDRDLFLIGSTIGRRSVKPKQPASKRAPSASKTNLRSLGVVGGPTPSATPLESLAA
jgi:DNA-binding protein H-NS